MTATVENPVVGSATPTTGGSTATILRANAVAGVLAAVATETLRAVVSAAGVHLAVGNPGGSSDDVVELTFGACTVMIAMCMIAGTVLAVLLQRHAARPARTYRVTALALVAVSLVAPLTAAATDTASKTTLVAAHLLAAAFVVPIVSRRLHATR